MTGIPLQAGYSFYYMRRSKRGKGEDDDWTDAVKPIGTARTIEEFWAIYDYIVRPDALPSTTDYHFFREGVKPTWEDPVNAAGGKWTVRLPKKGLLGARYWEEVILALIGGQFVGIPDGEITGAVISCRDREDVLSVWTKSGGNARMVNKVKEATRRLLRLPNHVTLHYHNHPRT